VTPTPRRYPIATYLRRYRPDAYDFLLLDEGHEYRNDGTAQERAAHRLAEGKPTLLLSGSISSGKSSSLFANMWACSQPFRREFARDQRAAFVTRYGYRKRLVEVASRDHEVVEYGTQTDRVDVNDLGETRALGEAPGVLPLFLVKHVLPIGVWMHKDDLDADLPPYTEVRAPVEPLPEQAQRYADVQQTVLHRITQDRFTRDYAGKLFGHLGELPSYLDRCTADTGNVPGAATWQVCYPAQIGGGLVAQAALFSATTLLPKETWLCETVQAELAEHRPVLIFVWHTQTGLHRRVQRVLTEAGIASTYLDANRVSTKRRQAWIEQQVAQGCTVLLVNPLAVQTGLNSLTHFCTGIWYEPICDAIVWRQANGRLHRIGQQQPVRIYAPEYTSTAQTVVLDLNALKVRAALALDGLDTSAALQASGAGDHTDDAYDLGRALYVRLTMQPQGAAPPARPTRDARQLRLPC
jgi:SNF2 family DNA or RNA helicase